MSYITVEKASSVPAVVWADLQAVGLQDCAASFKAEYDPEAYMGWQDQERFVASHLNPTSEVKRQPDDGRRFNANQVYYGARVAIASQAGEPVGWLYIAEHNVSGGGGPDEPHNTSLMARGIRMAKLVSGQHDYVWWRESYSIPGVRKQEVQTALLKNALMHIRRDRPVAPYPELGLFKDETEEIYAFPWLKAAGFVAAPHPFTKVMPGFGSVEAVRMQHSSSKQLRSSL